MKQKLTFVNENEKYHSPNDLSSQFWKGFTPDTANYHIAFTDQF